MMKVDNYILLKPLGKGSFGEVFLSTKEGTNKLFATKKYLTKEVESPEKFKYLQNEILILKELNHPNICKLEEVKRTKNNYYLFMEYVDGLSLSDCLEEYMKKYNTPFSEEIVQYLTRQIIDAFKYIHEKNIMHRDIKLENIMVRFNNENDKNNLNLLNSTIKIIDFGLSIKGISARTIVGCPLTMAPNLLKKYMNCMARKFTEEDVYDQKIDIWSIGVVCYHMLIGKSVFDAKFLDELFRKVEAGNYVLPINISKEAVSFFLSMLQYDSIKRLSAAELAQHPFLTKNIKEFSKIDTKKISNKIDNKGLNINTKKNESLMSIINKGNEKNGSGTKNNGNKYRLKRAHLINSIIFEQLYNKTNDSNIHSDDKNDISNNNNCIENYHGKMTNNQKMENQKREQPIKPEKSSDFCNIM